MKAVIIEDAEEEILDPKQLQFYGVDSDCNNDCYLKISEETRITGQSHKVT